MAANSSQTYIHYGWPSSPYSAKSRAALRASGLPWTEVQPNALTFSWLQAQVGRKVIPVLQTPHGRFVQDSSRITDAVEAASGLSLTPGHGLARIIALLFEVFADEWMIYPAMYFRWRYRGGNFDYMVQDFGRCAAPGLPGMVQRKAGLMIAQAMHRYLPIMGIDENTGPAIEAETRALIAELEAHFANHRFLLGDTPCIADFSMYGPLAAHIGRDPWSASVIDAFPHVRAWIRRLDGGLASPGRLHIDPGDAVLTTLRPILQRALRVAAPGWAEAHRLARAQRGGPGTTLRRRVGVFEAKLQCVDQVVVHPHKLTAVTAWKLQRPLRAMEAMGDTLPRDFLQALGAGELLELPVIDNFALDHIAFKKDATGFGGLGAVVDMVTPLLRRAPRVRPLHPAGKGPIPGLG